MNLSFYGLTRGPETKSTHLAVGLFTGLGQGLDETVPVNVVEEDVLALTATAHNLKNGAEKFDPHVPWHGVPPGWV